MGTATKHLESSASSLPAPGVVVRPARPDDDVAGLVFDAAPQAYTVVAGSEHLPVIVAHTGSRYGVARRALERYGLTPVKDRSWGYVPYAKSVDVQAVHP